MVAFGTMRTYAEDLNQPENVRSLKETIEEEKAADKKLSKISRKVKLRFLHAA